MEAVLAGATNLILEAPMGDVEGVVHRSVRVLMRDVRLRTFCHTVHFARDRRLTRGRLMVHDDFASRGPQIELHPKNRVATAVVMRSLDHHPAARELWKMMPKFFDLRFHAIDDRGRRVHVTECDLQGSTHSFGQGL